MNDVTGLPTISRNMVKKSDFCGFIAMRLHSFRLIDHDEMRILIERFYQIGISHRDSFIRIVLCVKGQANPITFFNRTLPINSFSIDKDMFFRA